MQGMISRVQRFLVSEDGPTAVEYAVMLALIIVACVTIITNLGTSMSSKFSSVSHGLPVVVWFGYEEPRVKQREEPVASPFLCSSCPRAAGRRGPDPGPAPAGSTAPI